MQAIAEFLDANVRHPEVRTLADCESLETPRIRYKMAFAAGRQSIVDLLKGQLASMNKD